MISCSSLTRTNPNINDINVSKELLQECTELEDLESGSKKEVILYIYDIKTQYTQCREKHKALSKIFIENIDNEN